MSTRLKFMFKWKAISVPGTHSCRVPDGLSDSVERGRRGFFGGARFSEPTRRTAGWGQPARHISRSADSSRVYWRGLMKHGGRFWEPSKLAAVLMVLVGLVSFSGCDSGHGQQTGGAPSVREVGTVTLVPERMELTTELPGRTSAYRVSEIRPQVSGLLMKRLFTEGTDVKAGQTLYQIDPSEFEAVLDNARAALTKAEANLPAVQSKARRYGELLADKAVSLQDHEDAVSAVNQAKAEIEYWKAQVKTARINLGYTKIAAPISGRIGRSAVTEGAIVTAYQAVPLAVIHQLDPIYVDVPQSTTDLLRLRNRLQQGHLDQSGEKQTKIKLILEDGSPYPLEGTLQFRDVSVEPSTGSVILRMVFPNPQLVLLPRMFVRAEVLEGVKEQALFVPQQGVLRTPKGDPYALVVNAEDKVERRMLHLDRAMDDRWLVADGLAPGERVIVEGIQYVQPGMPVKAVPFVDRKAGPGASGPGDAAPAKRPDGGA